MNRKAILLSDHDTVPASAEASDTRRDYSAFRLNACRSIPTWPP